MEDVVALAQGVYYFATGVWPLVSIGTFQRVTGPKTDLWLVKTVGLLIAVIGAALLYGGAAEAVGPALALVAVGSAAGLAGVDVVYVAKGIIARIYLLDAVAEGVLLAAWAVALTA